MKKRKISFKSTSQHDRNTFNVEKPNEGQEFIELSFTDISKSVIDDIDDIT